MATKIQLEAEIARLQRIIADQRKALAKLSADAGVIVSFPHALHAMGEGIPLMLDGNEHMCRDSILKVVWDVVRSHGIPIETPGITGDGELSFRGWTPGARFVVPTLAAELLAGFLNRIAEYGEAMHRKGHEEANALLKGLATGTCAPADYEDALKRKLPVSRPRVSIRRYKSRE